MSVVKIPRSVREVTKELGQIGELLTATEWKRAALVAAVVRIDSVGGRNARKPAGNGGFMSATEFSELGITGLRSKGTVTLYVQRWLDANGGKYPELGKSVRLPDLEWPPRDGSEGSRVSSDPIKAVEQLIEKHGPQAVAEAVVDDARLDTAVSRTRLDRVSTPQERRELRQRGERRKEELETAITASRAATADHMQHQIELDVMSARMHLRRGVKELENNPYIAPSQREELDKVLDECVHLISLLRQGSQEWSDNDRSFLAALGVES